MSWDGERKEKREREREKTRTSERERGKGRERERERERESRIAELRNVPVDAAGSQVNWRSELEKEELWQEQSPITSSWSAFKIRSFESIKERKQRGLICIMKPQLEVRAHRQGSSLGSFLTWLAHRSVSFFFFLLPLPQHLLLLLLPPPFLLVSLLHPFCPLNLFFKPQKFSTQYTLSKYTHASCSCSCQKLTSAV